MIGDGRVLPKLITLRSDSMCRFYHYLDAKTQYDSKDNSEGFNPCTDPSTASIFSDDLYEYCTNRKFQKGQRTQIINVYIPLGHIVTVLKLHSQNRSINCKKAYLRDDQD